MYRFQKQTKKSSAVQRTIQQCTATNILLIFFIQHILKYISTRSTTYNYELFYRTVALHYLHHTLHPPTTYRIPPTTCRIPPFLSLRWRIFNHFKRLISFVVSIPITRWTYNSKCTSKFNDEIVQCSLYPPYLIWSST